jgi:hypothetical protein
MKNKRNYCEVYLDRKQKIFFLKFRENRKKVTGGALPPNKLSNLLN